jgi:hypothetical protein
MSNDADWYAQYGAVLELDVKKAIASRDTPEGLNAAYVAGEISVEDLERRLDLMRALCPARLEI